MKLSTNERRFMISLLSIDYTGRDVHVCNGGRNHSVHFISHYYEQNYSGLLIQRNLKND